jgi:hypothetical protein
MSMKCGLKLAILLLITALPVVAQQRIPPWMRQQQQPANSAQPPAQTAPTAQPAQVQQHPARTAPGQAVSPNQQPTYPRPASVPPATNAARPATTTPTVPTPATANAAAGSKGAVAKKGKKSAKAEKKEEPPEPLPPAAPVAQMTPADLPPSPPQVSYLNGQLLVLSQNATLGEVLNAIRTRTGAQIEYPAAAAQERVATRLGPGPARDVLAQLLNGSRFDYVILGNPQQAGGVQKVILTPKQGGAQTEMASSPIQRAPAPAPPVQEDVNPDEDQNNDVSAVQPEQEPQVAQPSPQGIQPPGVAQPLQQPQANQQPFQNPPFQNPPFQTPFGQQPQTNGGANAQQPGQVKTPEQLLRELQQMQQQQQQQQQGQQPPPQ